MKSIKNYLYASVCVLLGTLLAACTGNESDLELDGDCLVTEFALGGLPGIVDRHESTITVLVPEDVATSDMQITALKLSEGAKANIAVGAHFNMDTPRSFTVVNGNLQQTWTIYAKVQRTYITQFKVAGVNGVINNEENTIVIYLKEGTDVSAVASTIAPSEGAEVEGDVDIIDFTGTSKDNAKKYVVTNAGKTRTYSVWVEFYTKPQGLYMSRADRVEDLNQEERAAYNWAFANIPMTQYSSLKDIANGTTDLSEVKIIYWHCAEDYNIDGHRPFLEYCCDATGKDRDGNEDVMIGRLYEADGLFNKLNAYFEQGGAFYLTRYASILPPFLHTSLNVDDPNNHWWDTWGTPNNCWFAKTEANPEICDGAWSFSIYGDNFEHPLFQNLVGGGTSSVYCTDPGYGVTNTVICYNHDSDWSDYHDSKGGYPRWEKKVQGRILGVNDFGAGNVVAWEFPAWTPDHNGEYGKGGIVCIGSGAFDWYSANTDYNEYFHKNVERLSMNAVNYLLGK